MNRFRKLSSEILMAIEDIETAEIEEEIAASFLRKMRNNYSYFAANSVIRDSDIRESFARDIRRYLHIAIDCLEFGGIDYYGFPNNFESFLYRQALTLILEREIGYLPNNLKERISVILEAIIERI